MNNSGTLNRKVGKSSQQASLQGSFTKLRPKSLSRSLKKKVSFGETQEHMLPPLPRDVQRELMYYTAQELDAQQEADMEKLRLMEKSSSSSSNDSSTCISISEDDEEVSFRGLEHALNMMQRMEHIRDFVETVLDAQFEQQEAGRSDAKELYTIARNHSKTDRKNAQRKAEQDMKDVMKMVKGDSCDYCVKFRRKNKSLQKVITKSFRKWQ